MTFIRVRDKSTRHEYTVPEGAFSDDAHERVTRKGAEAVDRFGRPLPPKYRLTSTQASSAPAGDQSTTDQEESRA